MTEEIYSVSKHLTSRMGTYNKEKPSECEALYKEIL